MLFASPIGSILTCHVCCIVVASLGCAAFWPQGSSGVLSGGVVMALNVALSSFFGRRMLAGGRRGALFAALLGVKLFGLLGLATALLYLVRPHPLAFAAGLSTFFAGLGLCGCVHWLRQLAAPRRNPSPLRH